jgi:hypothetical protein
MSRTQFLKNFGAWLLARLQEKSTWGALTAAVATLLGMHFAPASADAIGLIGTFIASGVAVSTREAPKGGAAEQPK